MAMVGIGAQCDEEDMFGEAMVEEEVGDVGLVEEI